ncbi:MAG: hypothetical protein EOO25_10810 [Comamonadaceae bacterium]|nr:MAG: hypothetical protein EOO25_10810 [Comamonadaceae bacterium]
MDQPRQHDRRAGHLEPIANRTAAPGPGGQRPGAGAHGPRRLGRPGQGLAGGAGRPAAARPGDCREWRRWVPAVVRAVPGRAGGAGHGFPGGAARPLPGRHRTSTHPHAYAAGGGRAAAGTVARELVCVRRAGPGRRVC